MAGTEAISFGAAANCLLYSVKSMDGFLAILRGNVT
jgi:hypothetical protein